MEIRLSRFHVTFFKEEGRKHVGNTRSFPRSWPLATARLTGERGGGRLCGHDGTGVALIEREGCIAARFKANVACKSAFRIGDVVIESSCLVPPAFLLNPDVTTSVSMSFFNVHPIVHPMLNHRTAPVYPELAYGK